MARKQENVTVPKWEGNRDGGKIFKLTEWPAARAEKWAMRFFIALKGQGSEIPETAWRLGMIGVAWGGINAFLRADVDFKDIDPLLDEMMGCVQIVRDPRHPDVATPIVSDDDIEEVQTLGWLRSEVLRLHSNFSLVDALLKWYLATSTQTDSSIT